MLQYPIILLLSPNIEDVLSNAMRHCLMLVDYLEFYIILVMTATLHNTRVCVMSHTMLALSDNTWTWISLLWKIIIFHLQSYSYRPIFRVEEWHKLLWYEIPYWLHYHCQPIAAHRSKIVMQSSYGPIADQHGARNVVHINLLFPWLNHRICLSC